MVQRRGVFYNGRIGDAYTKVKQQVRFGHCISDFPEIDRLT